MDQNNSEKKGYSNFLWEIKVGLTRQTNSDAVLWVYGFFMSIILRLFLFQYIEGGSKTSWLKPLWNTWYTVKEPHSLSQYHLHDADSSTAVLPETRLTINHKSWIWKQCFWGCLLSPFYVPLMRYLWCPFSIMKSLLSWSWTFPYPFSNSYLRDWRWTHPVYVSFGWRSMGETAR